MALWDEFSPKVAPSAEAPGKKSFVVLGMRDLSHRAPLVGAVATNRPFPTLPAFRSQFL